MTNERGRDIAHDPSLPRCLQHVSASQIKSWLECPRKWAFSKLKQISSPDTRATLKGRDIHAVAEEWGKTGRVANPETHAARLFAPALEHLPEWHPGLLAEANMATDSPIRCAGVPFVGFLDLCDPGAMLLVDYKTTKDLGYAKTEEELREDPQVIAYARWLMEREFFLEFRDAWSAPWLDAYGDRPVHVRFIYLLSRIPRDAFEPRVQVVEFDVTPRETLAPWAKFEGIVREMLDLAWTEERDTNGVRIESVTDNRDSCDNWGGCPHADRCPGTSLSDVLYQIGEKPVNSLSAMLENEAAKPGFDLYVDCVTVKGEHRGLTLETYVAPMLAAIVAAYNDAHPSAPVLDALEIPYGAWKGPLRALIASGAPDTDVAARSFGDVSNVAIEALRAQARRVVQGVR